MMKNFWNERFSTSEYIYGENPNTFFAEQLNKLPAGKIILPCDGEGRNGVYAAIHHWDVSAFDTSERGKEKALLLAHKNKVSLEYLIEDATIIEYPKNQYDVVAFIYAHFPPDIRASIHQKAITWLKPGGRIILEGFNPNQLKNSSGGPKNKDMLYTEAMLKNDFKTLKIELLQTAQIQLSEGKHHIGPADVIRFVGIKR